MGKTEVEKWKWSSSRRIGICYGKKNKVKENYKSGTEGRGKEEEKGKDH